MKGRYSKINDSCRTFVLFWDLAPTSGVMATGNNKKHVAMQANKGSTSMVVEPFSKKERSDVKPARIINHRDVGQTSTRRQGPRIPRACRNCRVLDPSLDDLMESDKCVTYSVELRCDGITNRDCLPVIQGGGWQTTRTGRSSRGGGLSPRGTGTSRRQRAWSGCSALR